MWTIFLRQLKDRRMLLLIYVVAIVVFLWMYIGFFPSFKDQTANLEELLKSFPESLSKAMNFDIKSFTTIEGFISTEQFSFVWPIMLIFMVVGFAGSAFSGEIEKGTIEILLSQPISRIKLFFGRYLAGLVMLITFVFFSIFSAIPLCKIYDLSISTDRLVSMSILGFMFGLAIYSISMFLSAIFSDKGKVFFISGGLLVLMYVINIIASIKDSLSDLKYASFFYYFNPSKALIHNQIDHWSYLIFIGLALVLTIVGAIWFSKRDITI